MSEQTVRALAYDADLHCLHCLQERGIETVRMELVSAARHGDSLDRGAFITTHAVREQIALVKRYPEEQRMSCGDCFKDLLSCRPYHDRHRWVKLLEQTCDEIVREVR